MNATVGRTQPSRSVLLRFWGLVSAVAVLVGLAVAMVSQQVPRAEQALPFLFIVATVGGISWWERRHRSLRLFSPLAMVLLLYVVLFGLVPLADVAYSHPLVSHLDWRTTGWLAMVGLVCLYLGYCFVRIAIDSHPRSETREWNGTLGSVASYAFLAVSVAALFMLFSVAGGFAGYLAVFRQRTLLLQGHVYLVLLIGLASVAALIQIGNWIARPTVARGARVLVLWFPAAVLITGALGARFRVVGLLLAIPAAYDLGYRRLPRLAVTAFLVVAATFFVLAGVSRNLIGGHGSAPSLAPDRFYANYLSTHDLGEFRDFVITVEGVPTALPFQHGRTFLSLIPGNAFLTGGGLYSSTFYPAEYAHGTSFSPSLPGELYMNFGAPGVAAGMSIFGLWLGVLETYRRRHPASVGVLVVYLYSLVPMALVLRGDFTSMVGYYLAGLVPLWIATRVIERPSRSASRDPAPERATISRGAEPRPIQPHGAGGEAAPPI